MGEEAEFYVTPPAPKSIERLKGWHGFLESGKGWGMFATFIGSISQDLAYEYPGADYLNSRYKENFAGFDEEEVVALRLACHALADARGHDRQAWLPEEQLEIFKKVQLKMGSITISELSGRWRLDSFHL
jgi:hypothetical protein